MTCHCATGADRLTLCVQGPVKAERVQLPMLPSIAPGATIENFSRSCSKSCACCTHIPLGMLIQGRCPQALAPFSSCRPASNKDHRSPFEGWDRTCGFRAYGADGWCYLQRTWSVPPRMRHLMWRERCRPPREQSARSCAWAGSLLPLQAWAARRMSTLSTSAPSAW